MTSPLAGASDDTRRAAAASLEEIIGRLRTLSHNPATANLLHFFEGERARTLGVDAQVERMATTVVEHDPVDGARDPMPAASDDREPTLVSSSADRVKKDDGVVGAQTTSRVDADASLPVVSNPDIVNTDSTVDPIDGDDDAKKPSREMSTAVDATSLAQSAAVLGQQDGCPGETTPVTLLAPLGESSAAPATTAPMQSDRDYLTLGRFVDLLGAMPRALATKYDAAFSLVALAFHVKTISPRIDFAQHTKSTHVWTIPRTVAAATEEQVPAFNVVNLARSVTSGVTVGSLYDALAPLAAANRDAAVCVATRALHTNVAVSFDIDEAVNYQDTTLNPMHHHGGGGVETIDDAIDLARRCIAADMSASQVLGMLTRRAPADADCGPLVLMRVGTQLVTAAELFERMGRRGFTTLPALKHIFAEVSVGDDSARGPAAVFMAETDVPMDVLLRAVDKGNAAMAALPYHDKPCSEFCLVARRLGML
ncbi:hypothetical protein psal_cds_633 [Pandoravirus salinus]|uniref:Uncharacterized protein n=1 Tax=Pandoravirus salinus TaxID=1349410 RepID=S4W261_9VIRU|nr:hypothetical protein psal_cds_633 [Pandoravirus salinus]AGO84522.1 hypothetical protein psal_cds_633 [Pandoravirus salinus]